MEYVIIAFAVGSAVVLAVQLFGGTVLDQFDVASTTMVGQTDGEAKPGGNGPGDPDPESGPGGGFPETDGTDFGAAEACFIAGTQVILGDGASTKSIEDLDLNDVVWAWNEETGKTTHHPFVRALLSEAATSVEPVLMTSNPIRGPPPGGFLKSPIKPSFDDEDVTPKTWRGIRLEIRKPDNSLAKISLLRPLWWIEETGATLGGTIHLNLPEMGINGEALISTIIPCTVDSSTLRQNARVITGTFEHENAIVYDLTFNNDTGKPLGVTPNHPLWSLDRNGWVEAGDLRLQERLRTKDNEDVRLTKKVQRPGRHKVYNVEVHKDHTYFVSDLGILAHNTCTVKLQPYRNDVLTKGVHGDVFKDGRKITEARLRLNGKKLEWFRWGDISTNRKELKEADQAIGKMLSDIEIMTGARTQVELAIAEMEANLTHGTKNQKDFAQRNLPKFRKMKEAIDKHLN